MNTRNIRFRSNRIRDIAALFHEELDVLYGAGEVEVFFEMLCEAFLGWDKVRLMMSKERTIDQSDLLRFHWALEDLRGERPIQHIIGYTDFCGCRIEVGSDVLIPRPETEEMVQWCIAGFPVPDIPFPVLDLCTGSGCIAIALKRVWPKAQVTAVDVSAEALHVARRNAAANGVEVDFVQTDLCSTTLHLPPCTLIVSNPPYVMESERAQMRRNVLEHDPALALFVPDDDPLRFYRVIAGNAKRCLSKEGLLVVEINEAMSEECCVLLRGHGFNPTVHDDFRGKSRWISATWNP